VMQCAWSIVLGRSRCAQDFVSLGGWRGWPRIIG
jgi:hypothetical protein